MNYSIEEIKQYIQEEDVKFVRLAFCDVFGRQKNISINAKEIARAFDYGIAFDASAIHGFGGEVQSDLLLKPDASTITVLPWRPTQGSVVRMYCNIQRPDGSILPVDTRSILEEAITDAAKEGLSFAFGSEMEFYLFLRDENGNPTAVPYDQAGYMDIAPEDKGENIRREICLTLEQMGIVMESSHHEEGPGQNEIDFRYADPLTAADNAQTFRTVVNTIAARNGLYADFSPKPHRSIPGNGMHINFSVKSRDNRDVMPSIIAGILDHIEAITLFLNTTENSYQRFGTSKAPRYISWSSQNRSQLIRIPAATGEYKRAELRSPDPIANPYLAYALMIRAGMDGLKRGLKLPPAADINFYTASPAETSKFHTLPATLNDAKQVASESEFLAKVLPEELLQCYTQ